MNYMPVLFDYLTEMEDLTDEEFGRLIRWGLRYQASGEVIDLPGNERLFRRRIQNQIDRYTENYEKKVAQCREAGRVGGLKKQANASESKQTVADASERVAESSESSQKEKKKEKEIKKDISIKEINRRFTPPTLDEVRDYCLERKNSVDAQRWFDYYSANGWKVGKNAMKDWKAAVRTWERSGNDSPKKQEKRPYGANNGHRDDSKAMEQIRRLREKMNSA